MGIVSILVQSDNENIISIDKYLFDKKSLNVSVLFLSTDWESDNVDVMRILGSQYSTTYVNLIDEELKIQESFCDESVGYAYEITIITDSSETATALGKYIHMMFTGIKDYIENDIVLNITKNIVTLSFGEGRESNKHIQFYK